MKKNKILVNIILLIIVLSFVASLVFYPRLPENMATHWNAQGEVDGYTSRFWGAFLNPLVLLGVTLLLLFIPRIDPLKENIMKFQDFYYGFIVIFCVFMLLVHLQILLWNVGIKISINLFVPLISGVLFYSAGVLMEKAKRNWFIGIRTPWTLSSDVVWEKTHKIGSVLFKICGAFAIVGAFFRSYSVYFIIIPLLASSAYLIFYSYVEFQKENRK